MVNQLLQRIQQRCFLRRLLLSFLSILTLILIFLLSGYIISSYKFKKQIYNKVNDNLAFISDTVASKIETVQKMALSFFNNETVSQYYRTDEDQSLEIHTEQWRICKVLRQSDSLFSDFVNRYYTYYTLSDRIYTGAGVYTKQFYFNDLYNYEQYPEDFWSNSFKNNSFYILQPSMLSSNTYGELGKVIPIIYTKNIQGKQVVFVADIDSQKIIEILDGVTFLNGINIMIFQDNELLIHNKDTVYSEDEIKILTNNIESVSNNKTIHIDGLNYYVFTTTSDYSSLSYIALVPKTELNSMMYSDLYYFLMLGIVLISCGGGLCIFLSYHIYKPISKVISSISEDTGAAIVDEFNYIQQSFSHMIEEKQHYSEKLEYYGESYVEHQMQLVVNGIEILKQEELMKILKERYGFVHDECICFNVLFNFSEEFYHSFTVVQQDVIHVQMREILQTILEKKEICYIFQVHKGIFTCVVNYDASKDICKIKQSICELEPIFREDSTLYKVHIGMDSTPVSIYNLSKAYNHAIIALRNVNSKMNFELANYDELSGKNKISFTFYDQKKIINCINIGNTDKLQKVINQILDDNQKRKIVYNDLQELYMQIYYVGQRCLEENQIEYSNKDKIYFIQEMIKNIRGEEDIHNSRNYMIEFLTEVLQLVNNKEQNVDYGTVSKIKKYIESNFHLNLSLDHIADEFGLSAKYVSKIFKQKTGENITNYIDRIRISQSKLYMTTTNMKIGDIASAVGIESRTTFFRIFRKLEGVSPNEYRTIASSGQLSEDEDKELDIL